MGKSSSANVIDLEAFRRKKQREAEVRPPPVAQPAALLVPVWYCWVPIWAPLP